jgi:uncharacterized protein (TIGR03435 family)
MKMLPIYELVVAKHGFKLKESQATPSNRIMPGHFDTHAMPMADFVSTLAAYVGSTIVDRTGLTGKYDFTLNWAVGEQAGPLLPGADGSLPQHNSGPTIFEALQQQLGLKLESTKGLVDVLVIDHIERPSEN